MEYGGIFEYTLVLIGVITLTWSIAKSIYEHKNKK